MAALQRSKAVYCKAARRNHEQWQTCCFHLILIRSIVGAGQISSCRCRGHGCMNCRHRNSGKEKFEVGESSWKNKEIEDDAPPLTRYCSIPTPLHQNPTWTSSQKSTHSVCHTAKFNIAGRRTIWKQTFRIKGRSGIISWYSPEPV